MAAVQLIAVRQKATDLHPQMTVWQKISDFAGAVGTAGNSLVENLAHVFGIERGAAPEQGAAFTIGVIALSAKMAKADGVVSPLEVAAFRKVFHASPAQAANVEHIFKLAKQDVAGYEAYADRMAALLKDDRKLLQDVIEGLLHVAAADGVLHPREDEYLRDVAHRFGFSPSEYRFFRARFVKDNRSPYDVLKIEPSARNDEIKSQYRKLVADNHPDRMIGRGVPAEFIEIATRKLAAINEAYATIAKERGL